MHSGSIRFACGIYDWSDRVGSLYGKLPGLYEPAKHLIERARHPDDVTAVQLDHRLVAALVGVMDDPHGLRSHRVADASSDVIRMNPPAIRSPCVATSCLQPLTGT